MSSNAESIREWWSKLTPMKLITHHGRFLNLHRYLIPADSVDGQIVDLPPLGLWSLKQIQDSSFINTDLGLTPNNLFQSDLAFSCRVSNFRCCQNFGIFQCWLNKFTGNL